MSVKKFEYRILPEHGIIVEKISGLVTGHELIGFKKNEMQDKDYQFHFDVIADLRKVDFASVEDIVEAFFGFYQEYFPLMKNKKSAYITRKPLQVAVLTLYGDKLKSTPMDIRIFSTTEAAVNWIGLTSSSLKFHEDILSVFST